MGDVWTAGHSNLDAAAFTAMLAAHRVEVAADVRSFPSSRRCPRFDCGDLAVRLSDAGLMYQWIAALGARRGRQHGVVASNGGWVNPPFRNYADYAHTTGFGAGLAELEQYALSYRTVCLCAEAQPTRCHRSILSDWMTARGRTVRHITSAGGAAVHVPGKWDAEPLIISGQVTYPADHRSLFPAAAGRTSGGLQG